MTVLIFNNVQNFKYNLQYILFLQRVYTSESNHGHWNSLEMVFFGIFALQISNNFILNESQADSTFGQFSNNSLQLVQLEVKFMASHFACLKLYILLITAFLFLAFLFLVHFLLKMGADFFYLGPRKNLAAKFWHLPEFGRQIFCEAWIKNLRPF